MRARFDIHSPINGRLTPPARYDYCSSPRRPALSDQPTSKPVLEQATSSVNDLLASDVALRLDDEIPQLELKKFATYLLESLFTEAQHASPSERQLLPIQEIIGQLPSLLQLRTELGETKEQKAEHIAFTKKLVKASEPLLNHTSIPESEKSSLLEVSSLAVEKMMQLKMRTENLTKRIRFIEKALPEYVDDLSQEMGYSKELGKEISQLTSLLISKS